MPSGTLSPTLEAIATEARRLGPAPAPPRTASILGLGHYLPAEVVPNGPIAGRIGVDDAWIVRRTGIHSRHRAAPGERLCDLAACAGRRALQHARVDPLDIGLVLVATMSQDQIAPNAAPLVAHALGAERAGAIDVGSASTGWISALAIGAAYVEAGHAERILVIGAETLTRLTDFDDRTTAALFGDGAGAAVLGPDGAGAIGPIMLRADGGLADTIVVSHEDQKIRIDGHDTFQNAVRCLSESTVSVVARAGLELDDVDLFVYHQANGRILRSVGERLGLPAAKVADYIGDIGNTSAASVPLTLDLLREEGRLRAGQRVLVAACGAGFNWGAGIVEWGIS
jgi:3-oxoacyl-[acyl-carrier-protein] synthase-3